MVEKKKLQGESAESVSQRGPVYHVGARKAVTKFSRVLRLEQGTTG